MNNDPCRETTWWQFYGSIYKLKDPKFGRSMKKSFHRLSRLAIRPGRVTHWLVSSMMKLFGWRVEGEIPAVPKFIAIGAYHTSNWDFLAMLGATFCLQVRVYWFGKNTLFRKPFGMIMRLLGGIPIRRDKNYNAVQQVIDEINRYEKIILVITPEGTRRKVTHWKTGFYYIALGAHIPICLCYINYQRKVIGLGPLLYPSGDIETDFATIREFYATAAVGKYPEKQGMLQVVQRPTHIPRLKQEKD